MNQLFELITMAFPKAGINVAEVPLTISILLYGILLIKYQNKILASINRINGLLKNYLFFIFVVLFITVLNFGKTSLFNSFVSLILIISPLSIVIGQNTELEKAKKILAFSLFIVGTYAIMQWFFGVENTAIYGVNITYGDNFLDKPIGWGVSGREAIKMPTTYQNGNGAAVFYSLAIPVIITWHPIKSKYRILKFFSVIVGLIGLVMSGSRSIIFPFIICIPMFLKFIKSKLSYEKQKMFISLIFIFIAFLIFYVLISNNNFITYIYERYMLEFVQNPTASGRTTQIVSIFEQLFQDGILTTLISIFIGFSWDRAIFGEGMFYMFSYYGLSGTILMIFMLVCTLKHIYKINKIVFLGFLIAVSAFFVDTSYCYIPSLINYYFIIGLFSQDKRNGR